MALHPADAPDTTDRTDAAHEGAVVDAAAAGGREKRAYVRRIFSEIAPRYDLLNHVLSLNVDRAWRRRALEALGWRARPAGVFLDVCAGTLDVGAQLVRQRDFRGLVVGADFAEPMLRAGVGKAPRAALVPVAADALELPIAAGTVDGAIVAFGIRNVQDLDGALREVHRVLAPGARFVILEFTTPPNALVRAGYHAYFHHVLPLVGRAVSGHRTAYAYLPKSVAHFPAPDALAARMRATGFAEVAWTRLTLGIAAIHVGTKS
ncbi:ubiquinone/menaquinone biosynthesis methyltransferase [Roseisolibacter agri]|uniref:Demethylmenaquinone methyltransferase n=1 Tax=Roseisolibacter agri TaxID=2014610 RepID=A0AA37QAZ0_9BACT|nr:ubiquinone/menaquinone biosynthesis methyltransferase [Roseisolibacter agri]GLC27982.1 demethylmenaquinone methyltransferase [Roseisolibacter agri]